MAQASFGHFEILDTLGSGGMGVVYRARDRRLQRDVALKLLRQDASWSAHARAHLLREARAISALNHPNICTVHDIGERDGQTFIVMELVQGTPLTLRLMRDGLDPETVVRWGAQLADALEHAHHHGVIHRDLKPSNVVVTPGGQVKLVDFGVAGRTAAAVQDTTLVEDTAAGSPRIAGTPPYMAPEVLAGGLADARSDVWSLGVVLHEALTGTRPFTGATSEAVAASILRDDPPDLPSRIPRSLAAVVKRCLAKDPGARYQRAGEVRAALDAIQTRPLTRPIVWWRATALAAAATLAVVAATVGALGLSRVRSWFVAAKPASAIDAPVQIRGLAVLPLRNIGGDPTQDFFADGMTSALITELAKVDRLKVISQTSVMRYRANSGRSLPEIGRELGVEAVIEGAILRVGDRVRISLDLVDAATDRHMWADSYDRPIEDVLGLQRDIARAVAAHVEAKVLADSPDAPFPKVNPRAYELFLRGEISVVQGNPIGVRQAVGYYQEAIAADPSFAPAYSGLAGAIFAQEFWGEAEFASTASRTRELIATALRLDANLADAHVMLARVQFNYDWQYQAAEQSLKRAIALAPGLAFAHETYCWVLLSLGRRDDAIAEARMAFALNPQSAYMAFTEGRVLYRVRSFAPAEERYKRAIALDPGFVPSYVPLIQLYVQQRRFDEARAVLAARDRLASARPAEWAGVLIDVASGRRPPPASVLAGLNPIARARINSVIGRYPDALAALEEATDRRLTMGPQLTDPEFDPLRPDPRFRRIVERMSLPADPLVAWGSWPASK